MNICGFPTIPILHDPFLKRLDAELIAVDDEKHLLNILDVSLEGAEPAECFMGMTGRA